MRPTFEQRFWSKVQKTDGCWLWIGARDRKGYGVIGIGASKMFKAHRMSLELSGIPVPATDLVLHRCDVPGCVNPAHLFLGTTQDNVRDRHAKGRSRAAYGVTHAKAKLSDAGIKVIRRSPLSNAELAAIFQITASSISRIRSNKTWKHI